MRDWKKILGGLAMACLLAACQADDWREARGGIRGSRGEASVGVETKSTPKELGKPLTTEFNVRVVKEGGSEIYNGKFPDETIPASAGSYTVTASYGENVGIAWDAPYYEGTTEEPVVVKDGETATATVTCKVANALFSATFPPAEEMEKAYEAYGLKVTVGSTSMTFKPGETRHIYVKAGSAVKYAFAYTRLSGEEGEAPLTSDELPTAPAAGTHYTINLTMDDKLGLDISKVEAEEVSISETIPLEWLPKPSVSATGFNANNSLTFAETEMKEAKLDLKLASVLQDIKFKFNFEDEQFSSLTKEEYIWSNAEDKKAISELLGITVSDKSIDLNALLAKLQTNAGEATTNTIEVDVLANDRWSSEDKEVNRTYTIICNKPEFSIAVQPGNVWTKTFTIDEPTVTAGDAEVLKKNLVYQYKEKDADDNAWQPCSGGLEQAFSEAPTNKAYQVRAFYREGIVSEVVDVELESPEQLPNSGMEKWSEDNYRGNRYSFNPWGTDETPFWDTNNDFTTRHRHNWSGLWDNIANYNGFHSVSYVEGHGGNGLAAELRSTANGRGNNELSGEADYNKVAGKLFTGTANVTMGTSGMFGDADGSKDTYTEEKNASFTSRPTALTFYYKYAPYNSDTWSVHIELLDENKNIIVQGDKTSSETKNDWAQETVPLNYEEGTTYAKCKYIYVIFKSTVNEGANMPYREITQTFYVLENGALSAHTYEPAYVGSVLTIDDISLIYDK